MVSVYDSAVPLLSVPMVSSVQLFQCSVPMVSVYNYLFHTLLCTYSLSVQLLLFHTLLCTYGLSVRLLLFHTLFCTYGLSVRLLLFHTLLCTYGLSVQTTAVPHTALYLLSQCTDFDQYIITSCITNTTW